MARQPYLSSIFTQALDRAVFVAYFLGAIVPLTALAIVVQRFVIPVVEGKYAAYGLVGVVVSISALSLGAFLVLRKTTHQNIARMDQDNLRLEQLLKASRALSLADHGSEGAATAARCALEMTNARAAFVLTRSDKDGKLSVRETAGTNAAELYPSLESAVRELVELALREGRPALGGADGAADGPAFATAAVPFEGEESPPGLILTVRAREHGAFDAAQVDALSTLAAFTSVALRNGELQDTQRNFFSHMTDLLVSALDTHLAYQAGHGQRVAEYANHLGRALGLDDRSLHHVHFAALLHDIGMLRIDRSLHHSKKVCEKHPTVGYAMLNRIRLWEEIAPVVRHHHEWFDGSGYPDGQSGDEIPLAARIISVADAFDAMTSTKSYRQVRSAAEAVKELETCSGTQFDPKLTSRFIELVQQGVIDPSHHG